MNITACMLLPLSRMRRAAIIKYWSIVFLYRFWETIDKFLTSMAMLNDTRLFCRLCVSTLYIEQCGRDKEGGGEREGVE